MAAAVVPYAAVGAGLYALGSAWAAILLYHLGIVIVLSITGWRSPVGAPHDYRRRLEVCAVHWIPN